jgi:prophage regulatory protein
LHFLCDNTFQVVIKCNDDCNLTPQGNNMSDTKIIKLPVVIKLTQLSRATIYRLIANGDFPKQIKLAERSSAWLEKEVLDYIESRITQRS